MEKEYKWDRFWCPSNKNYTVVNEGFLLDPEDPIAKYYDSTALRFDEIPDSPCLVLLGEPGIGKTKVLDDIYNLSKLEEGARTTRIDLRSYNTADGLVFDLMNNPEIQEWLNNNNSNLTIFFDSLDECLLNVRTVAALLIDRVIKNWPYQRLRLRFACRTIDWPSLLDNELCSIYGMDEVPKFELLPLRKKDVITAALAEGIQPDGFLKAVQDTEVTSFAIRPITLKFLLSCYKRDGHLPKQKSEIYWQGCLQLCEEKNKSRIASKQTGKLSPIERLIVASRIAAILLLSKKSSILLDSSDKMIPATDVSVQELLGFSESFKNIVVVVDENAIKEALNTGLFSSRGNNQIGFSHQTYAEYLAAYYLSRPRLLQDKVFELIFHFDGKVIPQLQELVIWLSTFSPVLFEKVLSIQPDLMLRVDDAITTDDHKKMLVSKLLNAYDSKEIVDVLDVIPYLDHVNYPGLSDQLMSILKDKSKSIDARHLAILIARDCKVVELLDLLVSIALHGSENYRVRKYAAHAVMAIGGKEEKARLLPLALGISGDDPQDELKGIGLKAVWPDHISLDITLNAITPMKNENLIGEYYMFLDYDFVAGLRIEYLPKAIGWVIDGMPMLGSEIVMDNLIVSLMRKGWDNIENPEIGPVFVRLVEKRLQNYEEARSFSKDKSYLAEIKLQPKKRRLLIELLVKLIDNPQNVWGLLSVGSPIVLYDDLEWIVEKIEIEGILEKKAVWAQILYYLIDRNNPDDVMKAFSTYETYPDVSTIFGPMFAPILLDSELARSSREYNRVMKEREVRQEVESVVPVDYQGRLLEYVEQFEMGDSNAWWMLNLLFLTGEPNRNGNEFDADLTLLFLWKQISDEIKDRLLTIAEEYLDKHPAGAIYTEDKHLWRPALSAFRAFYLIATKKPERLNSISPDVWNKWGLVLLSYPDAGRRYGVVTHQNLISELFRNKDDKFYELLLEQIKNENANNYFHILKLLEPIESAELQDFLASLLGEDELPPYALGELLRFLLSRGNSTAKEFALNIVCSEMPRDEIYKKKRLTTARALILHANDAGWSAINQEIKKDSEFGESLFQSLAHLWDSLAIVLISKLSELEIADLYIWLEERFPAKDDPRETGMHSVTERESVGQFRDSLIQVLSKKGSERACKVLAQLVNKFPDKEWFLHYLHVSEMNFRRNTWEPLKPYQVLEILQNANEDQVMISRKIKLRNIAIIIFVVLATLVTIVLPNTVDYKNNLVLNFFATHQCLTLLLLVLSAVFLVLINTKLSDSD